MSEGGSRLFFFLVFADPKLGEGLEVECGRTRGDFIGPPTSPDYSEQTHLQHWESCTSAGILYRDTE